MMLKKTSYDLDSVNVSFLDKKKTAPLVISPRFDDTLEFISTWLEKNRSWVEEQILVYGAVLIRGFQVDNAIDFERATLALQPNLCDAYRGTSPRTLQAGTKYAFSAADVPVNYPIAQHCEMSFLKAPPRNLYFGCVQESKKEGGETALCDFRKVYQQLPPALRNKFTTKKIKYTRTHHKVGDKFTYDVGAMLSWTKLFDTEDLDEVERICLDEQSPKVQWVGANKDTFLQEWIDEPYVRHPVTNEYVWFNHAQVFHWTTFSAELWFAFKRIKDFHLFLHFLLVSIFTFIKYGLLGYTMALSSDFGDGEPITLKEMNEIREVIHENMVFSRWNKGDILCIDNFSTSHGRQPTYDKGRKVIVAWSPPYDKTPHIAPETHNLVEEPTKGLLIKTDKKLPDLVATADSTLTSQEAQDLKESFLEHRLREEMTIAFSKTS